MEAGRRAGSWGAEVREVDDESVLVAEELSQRCDENRGQRSFEARYCCETAKERAAPTTVNVPMAVEADVEPPVKDGTLRRAGPRSVKLL